MRFGWCIAWLVLWAANGHAGQGVDVSFFTADSVAISATYYAPPQSPAPAVVLVTMLGRTRESWSDLADSLQSAGFAVLTFDLRGHGQSVRSPGRILQLDSFADSDYAAMIRDAAAAVNWLRHKTEILPEKIGILGAGFGANLALAYAATDIRIRAVALVSPGEVYRGIDAIRAIKEYSPRPVYIAYAEDDNYSAITVRSLTEFAGGPKTLNVFPEGGHGMYLFGNIPGLMANITSFFTAQLR